MSHLLSHSLNQQLRMEQRLTPQLIQSMTVLQKPVAELEAYIQSALESNAALEVEEPGSTEVRIQDSHDAGRSGAADNRDAVSFARLDRFARDYDYEINDRPPSRTHRFTSDDGRDPKMGAMANTAGRSESLHEHLLSQWGLAEVDDVVRRAGEAIIDHIDPDGYLRTRPEDIARALPSPVSTQVIEQALKEVQKLDPPGVGAGDLVECLLLQVDRLPGDNRLERLLIARHLNDISHNRLPAVARATGHSIGEIQEAIRAMRSTLCIHPGYLIGDRSVPPIRPDVIVEYAVTGGGLSVRLARGNAPRLRIRDELVALARSRQNGKETRDFARKHVDEAAALIDAVKFRQNRLLEVARAVVEKQRDFFDVGSEGLKVLRMSELAEELGCDPSTISRTVADKYIQTPRGIYSLRFFFTGGTETDDGESMGWERVRGRVRELIEAEDKRNPLSDDQVAALLRKEGIEISRRTVAKYRQQLDLPAARQRRRY